MDSKKSQSSCSW